VKTDYRPDDVKAKAEKALAPVKDRQDLHIHYMAPFMFATDGADQVGPAYHAAVVALREEATGYNDINRVDASRVDTMARELPQLYASVDQARDFRWQGVEPDDVVTDADLAKLGEFAELMQETQKKLFDMRSSSPSNAMWEFNMAVDQAQRSYSVWGIHDYDTESALSRAESAYQSLQVHLRDDTPKDPRVAHLFNDSGEMQPRESVMNTYNHLLHMRATTPRSRSW
jgi:hypothetical protein